MTSPRSHRVPHRPTLRPTLVTLAAALGTVMTLVIPAGSTGAAATRPTDPPLATVVIAQPLPGFAAAPTGPTNGPLTAVEFASQSSTPRQAEAQFDALAAQAHFGAYIRLWTDRSDPGRGANDVAVLVFRIPRTGGSQAFAAGLQTPFVDSAGSVPFGVPSIPGARGISVPISTPVRAVEQIVVFRAGQYVTMSELASATAASNPDPLTPSEAISVSYQQYQLLRHGDPAGSSDAPPAASPPPAVIHAGSSGEWPVVALVVVVLAVVVAVMAVIVRRRRGSSATAGPVTDPWAPGGLFDQFGAVRPGAGGTGFFSDTGSGVWRHRAAGTVPDAATADSPPSPGGGRSVRVGSAPGARD